MHAHKSFSFAHLLKSTPNLIKIALSSLYTRDDAVL